MALKTFVDNVCRQVIERHLLNPLPQVFCPEEVAAMDDDELYKILGFPFAEPVSDGAVLRTE